MDTDFDPELVCNTIIKKGNWIQDLELKHWNGKTYLTKVRFHSFESEGNLFVVQRVINVEELHSAVQIIRQEKQRFESFPVSVF